MYLLDTNLISETRRPSRTHPNVKAWLAATHPQNLYTSAAVMMELERGVLAMGRRDPKQDSILREWLETVVKPSFAGRILPIDETTARICARLHIPDKAPENDAWIAATAMQRGLKLATRNIKDFRHDGLQAFDPFA